MDQGPAQPGQRVGHYQIIEEVGRGGMGVVYRAQDVTLRRPVALKCPWPLPTSDPRTRKRFLREARAASQLSHPNVIPIFEVLEESGTPWIAMQLVDGTSLSALLATGKPFPVKETLEHSYGLASALQAAHDRHILHRDVNPNNVLVSADGRALLSDFGLAEFVQIPEEFSTQSRHPEEKGQVVGTLRYMSPEQALGKPLDRRSDIFSLGAVIYEMCTGRQAFSGSGRGDVIDAILHREPVAISRLNYEVPESLERIVRKTLAKDPDERYQDARDLLADLRAVRARSGHVDDVTSARTAVRRRRTARNLAIGIALASALALALRIPRNAPPLPVEPGRTRLGILLPQNLAPAAAIANWPTLIQALFVGELTGVEELAVVDPLSLNGLVAASLGSGEPPRTPRLYEALKAAQLSVLVDGSITAVSQGFRLQANLVDAGTGEMQSSHDTVIDGEAALPAAVARLAREILTSLQVKVLPGRKDKDLRPWMSQRGKNLEALKAFVQARQNIYRNQSGIVHLQRAVDLDPTFTAARVWLISGLALSGRMEEAREHYRHLQLLEPSASPFEQAMIGWAGAYLAADQPAQERQLAIALEYSPGNNILLFTLADTRLRMGDNQGCLTALDPAIQMKWDYPQVPALRAACLTGLGRFAQARQTLEAALETSPVHPDVYGLLSALDRREGDAASAERNERSYRERSRQLGISEKRILEKLSLHLKRAGLAGRAAEVDKEAAAAAGAPVETPAR